MTCDLYFTILVEVFMNHNSRKLIFLKLCRVNITQDYGLKPANKYQIIWQCHNLKITSHQQSLEMYHFEELSKLAKSI